MPYDHWNITGYDRQTAVRLYRAGFNSLLSVLLVSRGIDSPEAYTHTYGCQGVCLSDPMSITDMDKAVSRIRLARQRGEKIAVYGDYDVDGITASCILSDHLRRMGCDCSTYIPERLKDGYGLKAEALDQLKEQGIQLVVTVDCGITAACEAAYAAQIGLDLIITDHHTLGEELPAAIAVVNPKRDGEEHPCYYLAGVGVAFKLACALSSPDEAGALMERYGDLLALGTIADVMPLVDENRLMVKHGLKKMQTAPRVGIKALCRASGLCPRQLNSTAVGYTLAPRINASGRLGETALSVRLMETEDEAEAEALSLQLCELNRRRQAIEQEVMEEAMRSLPEEPDGPVVVVGADWHQGVAGIVASKLSDKYHVPAVVICVKDGIGHGSCRCQGDFCLVGALRSCADLLVNCGGHNLAAGLTIEEANIPEFRRRLNEYCAQNGGAKFLSSLDIDFEVIDASILSVENVDGLSALEPFGSRNPQPVLCMRDVSVDMVTALKGGRHTKLWLSRDGQSFAGMCFSRTTAQLAISDGDTVDIAFTPNINEYRGRRSVQLIIKDIIKHA